MDDIRAGPRSPNNGIEAAFTAHGTPTDAYGQMRFKRGDLFTLVGTVDCVNVQANTAILSGPVTQTGGSVDFPTDHFIIFAHDNDGQPGGPPDTFDFIPADLLPLEIEPFNQDCRLAEADTLRFEQGNIVVRDYTP